MGGKTFPAVQFLDTFHDHIKSITKTKPRSPLAFWPLWLGVGQGRKPRGGGRGWRAPEAWESPLLAESPGEGGGSVRSPRCTEGPQIFIQQTLMGTHSALGISVLGTQDGQGLKVPGLPIGLTQGTSQR